MKKLIYVLAFFGSFVASAQELDFQVAVVTGFTRAKSYKGFTEIYNQTNSGTLTKKLNSPHVLTGVDFMIDGCMNRLYFGGGLTKLFGESTAKFNNGGKRHIDLNQNHFYAVLGYGNYSETSQFSISMGVSAKKSYMHSYFEYTTGDKDYVTGQINGTYSSVGIGLPIMAHFAWKKGTWWIFSKVQFQYIFADKFTYFKGTSTASSNSGAVYQGYEIVEDNKNLLIEFGVKRNFNEQ